MLPSNNTVLEKGNLHHAVQLKVVEDCAWVLDILTFDQKSTLILYTSARSKGSGRSKLEKSYEVWKWMKSKFDLGGNIFEMKMEDKLLAPKLDANDDQKKILDKIAGAYLD